MFWRFRDPKHPLHTEQGAKKYGRAVEDTYIRMDEIVGKAMERLENTDLLMVMSDHGFHSFRTGFNVNTWLIRNGYLAVKGQPDAATAVTLYVAWRRTEGRWQWRWTKRNAPKQS